MKSALLPTAAITLASAGFAHAGGLDRSGQSINVIFEEGRHAEISLGYVMPNVDASAAGGGPTLSENVAKNYLRSASAYKADYSSSISYAIIFDQPFGADVRYSGGPLDGIFADVDSYAITGVVKYKMQNNFSIYGGVTAQNVGASIQIPTGALEFDSNWGFGWLVGAAYEIPDIALRGSLTYRSAVEHGFDTTFNGNPAGTTNVMTPQSVNLDFQTGIMADTLLMFSARWANWEQTKITPPRFPQSIVDINNSVSYSIGIGRKFNDTFSGAFYIGYEPGDGQETSPLSPTDGYLSATLGGSYTSGPIKITGGISYIMPGGTLLSGTGGDVETRDNNAIGFGIKLSRKF